MARLLGLTGSSAGFDELDWQDRVVLSQEDRLCFESSVQDRHRIEGRFAAVYFHVPID